MSGGAKLYEAPPGAPPPGYGTPKQNPVTPQYTGGYSNPISPQQTGNTNFTDPRAPDQAYHNNAGYASPPPGAGYYGSNNGPNPYGPAAYGNMPPAGYYGGPNQGPYNGPPPQGMQYAQPYGPPAGYYQDNRRATSSGSGICAGILGALACCCCLDILF